MTLTYLTNQVVYLGSHFGDLQLLQIAPSSVSSLDRPTLPILASIPTIKPNDLSLVAKNKIDEDAEGIIVNGVDNYLELKSFNNLAPIVDGILIDIDDSGQVCVTLGFRTTLRLFIEEIVRCSGGRVHSGLSEVVPTFRR
ncbi:hypothetical protein HD554DRAFT_2127153 [Boletus coccyginus]|nr:hypothetical protein HD554DRAFT_2127153 [Boletus coccyginus]